MGERWEGGGEVNLGNMKYHMLNENDKAGRVVE